MSSGASDVSVAKDFWRSVAVVLTGSVVAQSIPLLGALVIARIYAPAEFGLFSAWFGVVMLVAVVVTARFEMTLAVVADGAPRRFAMVATLSTILVVSLILALIAAAAYMAFGLPNRATPSMAMLLVPAAALIGMAHTWQAWAASEGSYRKLSWIRIGQAFVVTSAQIGAGLVSPTAFGMMFGQVLGLSAGLAIAMALMPIGAHDIGSRTQFWKNLKAFLIIQRRFPIYALPADTVNAASGQLPILLIATRFGPEASGLFALTLKVLGAPIGLLGAAILDVFKRSAAAQYRDTGSCREQYMRTFWMLSASGLALAVGVMVVADSLFVVAFGEPWRGAGTIAVWLMPMFAMRFIASPLSYVFYIAGKQHVDLGWQCALLIMTIAAFSLPKSFDASVQLYSAGYSLLYVAYAFLSYRYSKGRQE